MSQRVPQFCLVRSYVHGNINRVNFTPGIFPVPVVRSEAPAIWEFILQEQTGTYVIQKVPGAASAQEEPVNLEVQNEYLSLTTSAVNIQWFVTYEPQRKVFLISRADDLSHWSLADKKLDTPVKVEGGAGGPIHGEVSRVNEDAFWVLQEVTP